MGNRDVREPTCEAPEIQSLHMGHAPWLLGITSILGGSAQALSS